MNKEVIENKIISYITNNFLSGEDGLTAGTPVIDLNIVDSASLFDVVDYMNREFDVAVPFELINPKNFETIKAMSAMVERLR